MSPQSAQPEVPVIAIAAVSEEELDWLDAARLLLERLGVRVRGFQLAAWNDPRVLAGRVARAEAEGVAGWIVAAGAVVALPGMIAAAGLAPVIAVPLAFGSFSDAEITQLTLATGPAAPVMAVEPGAAESAALAALRMLAASDARCRRALEAYQEESRDSAEGGEDAYDHPSADAREREAAHDDAHDDDDEIVAAPTPLTPEEFAIAARVAAASASLRVELEVEEEEEEADEDAMALAASAPEAAASLSDADAARARAANEADEEEDEDEDDDAEDDAPEEEEEEAGEVDARAPQGERWVDSEDASVNLRAAQVDRPLRGPVARPAASAATEAEDSALHFVTPAAAEGRPARPSGRPPRKLGRRIIDPDDLDALLIEDAVDCLLEGGVIALPTETVYGLAVDATNPAAVQRLFEVKGRPRHKAISLIIDSPRLLALIARNMTTETRRLMEAFWPGPLTLILEKRGQSFGHISDDETIGVRLPDHNVPLALVQAMARPLACTSANFTGKPDCRSADEIEDIFGDTLDLILDAGPIDGRTPPSTVLDLSREPYRVLREGSITHAQLATLLGDKLEGED